MKKQFPFFKGYDDLHYFDSAATTLKPQLVIDAITEAYSRYTIPIEKSVYKEAEIHYEELVIPLKACLQRIFSAYNQEIFFGHSITALLYQIVDFCIGVILKNKDIITVLLPETVHNSFYLSLKKYKQVDFVYYNTNSKELLSKHKFDIIYVPTIDHITGEQISYIDIIEYKKNNTVIVIGDASQSGMYESENLSTLFFDFFLLSSHKMYGPEGLAVVMISKMLLDKYKKIEKDSSSGYFLRNFFALGSLPYTAFYGFFKALTFLEKNIYNNASYKEKQFELLDSIYRNISNNNSLVSISSSKTKTITTFYHKNTHAHDIAIELSNYNICVRSGDLCSRFNKNNTGLVRISIGCYVDEQDVSIINRLLSRI
jgi:cysteine desulfurase/selenocysteine lyase